MSIDKQVSPERKDVATPKDPASDNLNSVRDQLSQPDASKVNGAKPAATEAAPANGDATKPGATPPASDAAAKPAATPPAADAATKPATAQAADAAQPAATATTGDTATKPATPQGADAAPKAVDAAPRTSDAVAPATDNTRTAKTPEQSYNDIFNKNLFNADKALDTPDGLNKAEKRYKLALKEADNIDQQAVDDMQKALQKQLKEDASLTKEQKDVIEQKVQDLDALKNAKAIVEANWGLALIRMGTDEQATAGGKLLVDAVNLNPAFKGDPNFLAHYQTALQDHQDGKRGTGPMPVITPEQLAQARGDATTNAPAPAGQDAAPATPAPAGQDATPATPAPAGADQGAATRRTETPEQRAERIDRQRAAAIQREDERHNKVLHDIDDIYQQQKSSLAAPKPGAVGADSAPAKPAPAADGQDRQALTRDVAKTNDQPAPGSDAAKPPHSNVADAMHLSQFLKTQYDKLAADVAQQEKTMTDDASKRAVEQKAMDALVAVVKKTEPKFKELIAAADAGDSPLLPGILAKEKDLVAQLQPKLNPPTPEIKEKLGNIYGLIDKALAGDPATRPEFADVLKANGVKPEDQDAFKKKYVASLKDTFTKLAQNDQATSPDEHDLMKKTFVEQLVPVAENATPTKEQQDLRTQIKAALDAYDGAQGADTVNKRLELNGLVAQEGIERQQDALTRFAYAQSLMLINDKAGAKQQMIEAAARVQTNDVLRAIMPSVQGLGITEAELKAEGEKVSAAAKARTNAAPDAAVTAPPAAPEANKPVVAPETTPKAGTPDAAITAPPAAPEANKPVVAPETTPKAGAPDAAVTAPPAAPEANKPVVAPETTPKVGAPPVAPEANKPVVAPEAAAKPAAPEVTVTPAAADAAPKTTDAAYKPGTVPTDEQMAALASTHAGALKTVQDLQLQIAQKASPAEAKAEFLKSQEQIKAGLATMDSAFAPIASYQQKLQADHDAFLKGLSPADKAVVDRKTQLDSDLTKIVSALPKEDQQMFFAIRDHKTLPGVQNWDTVSNEWITAHKPVVDAFNSRGDYAKMPENKPVLDKLASMEHKLAVLDNIASDQALAHLNYASNLSSLGGDKAAAKQAFDDSFKNITPATKADLLAVPQVDALQRAITTPDKADIMAGIYGEVKKSGDDEVDKLAKENTPDALLQGAKDKLKEAATALEEAKTSREDAAAKKNPDGIEAAKAQQAEANAKSKALYEQADKQLRAAVIKADSVDSQKINERITQIQKSLETGKIADPATGKERDMTPEERRQAHIDSLSLLNLAGRPLQVRQEYAAFEIVGRRFLDGQTRFPDLAKTMNSYSGALDRFPVDLMNKQNTLMLRDIQDPKNASISADMIAGQREFNKLRQLPLTVTRDAAYLFVSGGNQPNGKKIGFPPFPKDSEPVDTKINDAERAWYFRDKWVEMGIKINNVDPRDLDNKDPQKQPFDAKAVSTVRSSSELQTLETVVRLNSPEALVKERDKAGRPAWSMLSDALSVGAGMTAAGLTYWAMTKAGAGAEARTASKTAAELVAGTGTARNMLKYGATALTGEATTVLATYGTHKTLAEKDMDMSDAFLRGSVLFGATALTVAGAKGGASLWLRKATPEAMDAVGLERIAARNNAMAPSVAHDFAGLSDAEKKAKGLIGSTAPEMTPRQVLARTGEVDPNFKAASSVFAQKHGEKPLFEIENSVAERVKSPDSLVSVPAQRDQAILQTYRDQGISNGQTARQAHETATAGTKMKPTDELVALANHPEYGNTPISQLRQMAKEDPQLLKQIAPLENITEASAGAKNVGVLYQERAEAKAASEVAHGQLTQEIGKVREGETQLAALPAELHDKPASEILSEFKGQGADTAAAEIAALEHAVGVSPNATLKEAIAITQTRAGELEHTAAEGLKTQAQAQKELDALKVLADNPKLVGLSLDDAKKAFAESAAAKPELQNSLDRMYGAAPKYNAMWLNSLPTADTAAGAGRKGVLGFFANRVPNSIMSTGRWTGDFVKGLNPLGMAPESINNASLMATQTALTTPGYIAWSTGLKYADKDYAHKHEGAIETPWEAIVSDYKAQGRELAKNPWSGVPMAAWQVLGSVGFSNMLAWELRNTVSSGVVSNVRNVFQPIGEAKNAFQFMQQVTFWGAGMTGIGSVVNIFEPGKGFVDSRILGAGNMPTWNSALTNRENTKKLFSGPGLTGEIQFQPPTDQPGLTSNVKLSLDPNAGKAKLTPEVPKVSTPPVQATRPSTSAPAAEKPAVPAPAPEAAKPAPEAQATPAPAAEKPEKPAAKPVEKVVPLTAPKVGPVSPQSLVPKGTGDQAPKPDAQAPAASVDDLK